MFILELAEAAAAIAAAILAYQAKKISEQANKHSETSNSFAALANELTERSNELTRLAHQQTKDFRDDDRRELEEQKRREMASSVQAWWVIREPGQEWGVYLKNEGPSDSVLYNFAMSVKLNNEDARYSAKVLPPGRYFIRWTKGDPKARIEVAGSEDVFAPVAYGETHSVQLMKFRDNTNRCWKWTQDRGFRRVECTS